MNWLKNHMSTTILIVLFTFIAIAVSISVWVGEKEGFLFFGGVPTTIIGYLFGEDRGKNKVGNKIRKAKEDARSMVDSQNRFTKASEKRSGQYAVPDVTVDGITYNTNRYWEVIDTLEQEVKRNKSEAERLERLLFELGNIGLRDE
ncbi:hypothetical protein ACFLXK_03470 [Chloroflexota bacterium]